MSIAESWCMVMREILFRGKCVDSAEWVNGFYSRVTNNWEQKNVHFITCYKDLANGETILTGQHIVAPETVGQFTGLLDRNGKKIFEGDIVSLTKWSKLNFLIQYKDSQWYLVNAKGINCFCLSIYKEDKLCILGNIYDNPELLN